MKYAIIGAGGTGGSLGFFLTKAGKDVTLIARGKHLEAIRKNGLGMERLWDHKREMIPVKACHRQAQISLLQWHIEYRRAEPLRSM